MFSYRLLHSPRKKNVSFLIPFNINPFFVFHFVAFPFENVCSALIFAFHSVWFPSLCPVLPHNYLLFSLSHTRSYALSISLQTVVSSLMRHCRIKHLLLACLRSPARFAFVCLPACLLDCACACIAIRVCLHCI